MYSTYVTKHDGNIQAIKSRLRAGFVHVEVAL